MVGLSVAVLGVAALSVAVLGATALDVAVSNVATVEPPYICHIGLLMTRKAFRLQQKSSSGSVSWSFACIEKSDFL